MPPQITEHSRFLVDRGAQLNVQDEDGWTALELASRGGNFGTVVLLCEAGADITLKGGSITTLVMLLL